MQIAVLGASGFVGRAVVSGLSAAGYHTVIIGRTRFGSVPAGAEERIVGSFERVNNWDRALSGCERAIYLAARNHVMRESSSDPIAAYRQVNTVAAIAAATGAAQAGVRRFVYMSSIKVNGERTDGGKAFDENSVPAPADAYARSKLEAELAIAEVSNRTGIEVVALRPPLIYGPDAKGNLPRLAALARLSAKIPLPLGSVANRRSVLFLDHLVNALTMVASHSGLLPRTMLIADPDPISTPDLIRSVGAAIGVRPRLFPCPPSALLMAASAIGARSDASRLLDSLEVNAGLLRRETGWDSPTPLGEAMRRSFDDHRKRK